jgi:hypothetical protein
MYKIIGADGKEYGPVPAEVVRQWLVEGRANAQTRVLPEGAAEWKPLGELPEFRSEPSPGVPQPIGPLTTRPGQRTNSLAVVGLVLGIISVPFSFCCYGLPFNLAGIVISIVALVQINEQKQEGRGLAIAGLVLSVASIVLAVLWVILSFAIANPMRRIHRL